MERWGCGKGNARRGQHETSKGVTHCAIGISVDGPLSSISSISASSWAVGVYIVSAHVLVVCAYQAQSSHLPSPGD